MLSQALTTSASRCRRQLRLPICGVFLGSLALGCLATPPALSGDGGLEDSGAGDAGMTDANMPDAGGPADSGADGGWSDAGWRDGGSTDAGRVDGGADAGAPRLDGGAAGDWRHFYGIAWAGNASNNLRFAQNMGYQYAVAQNAAYRDLPEAHDLKFYLSDPWNHTFSGQLDTTSYSAAQRLEFENLGVWRTVDAFPANIAPGWYVSNTRFLVSLDFQQQAVIDTTIDKIIALARSWENPLGFTFAGVLTDEPVLSGDFWSAPTGGRRVTLSYWTGGPESCAAPANRHTHAYATYSDGSAAFFKALYQRVRAAFPRAHFMIEPFEPLTWLSSIQARADRFELMPSDLLLSQEGPGTQFVEDGRIYNNATLSALLVKERTGSSQPDRGGEADNRLYAATAALNGAWYNWYGKFRFGPQGDTTGPEYGDISEVPARLKLVRMVAGWDNISRVPLPSRSWNGMLYQSPNSRISPDVIYSRRPDTGELYVVFITRNGNVQLRAGESVAAVSRVNPLFGKSGDGTADLVVSGDRVSLSGTAAVPADGSGLALILNLQR